MVLAAVIKCAGAGCSINNTCAENFLMSFVRCAARRSA